MEAVDVGQDDAQADTAHHNSRSGIAHSYDSSQGFHHHSELVELNNLRVPTHKFSAQSTSGPGPLLSRVRTPENTQEMTTETFPSLGLGVRASENSDNFSLRSLTQSTASSTISTSAPSSDADSSAKTMSTAPTSTTSCSTHLSGIQEVQKGVFAAPKMAMELDDRLAWDKIQPKLQDTIFNTFRPQKDLDDTISCEFMMGGPSPAQLAPTVFLVCCHEAYRKQLRAILKRQKWMRAYKYQCVVIVDTLEDLSQNSLASIDGSNQLLVEAFVPSWKTSWCGLKARARSGIDQEPINFTIGGILLIDREAFGLTVRHGIDKLITIDDASDDADDDDDDSGVEDSSSPFIIFEDEELIQGQDPSHIEKQALSFESRNAAPHVYTSLVDQNSPERTQYEGGWLHFGQYHAPKNVGSTMRCGQLDWSLVKFEPRCGVSDSSFVNTLVTPTNDHMETKGFLNRSNLTAGEVWINAGSSGPVKGWLLDCPALLHRHGKSFEVLQVIPEQPLAPGDSGSWVLMADFLCGHVLASRKSVPWLYVLPISEIIAEAQEIMSCQEVTLPQHHADFNLSALTNNSIDPCSHAPTIASVSTATNAECDIDYWKIEAPVVIQPDSQAHLFYVIAKPEMIRACLGSLYLEGAGLPGLDYSAFEDHCRSRLSDYNTVIYGSFDNLDRLYSDVLDILQMIRTGLHRDEVEDTLRQRVGPGSVNSRFLQERVNRAASLLVMTEIGKVAEYGRRARLSWESGTLQQLIHSHFTGDKVLTDTSIRLEQTFTAKSLVQIAGLRIFWTANLSDHLLLDRQKSMVHIFHHATYLECQRRSTESLLPDGLAEETLTSLALLFPSSSSSAVPAWLRNSIASDPEHDSFLHAIRNGPLEPHERDIRSFHYWHDRIVILKQALDEAPATHSLARFWHDRRDSRQWYTFWIVLVSGTVTVTLLVVQVVIASVQLVTTKLADQPSSTDHLPEAKTPKAKEGGSHNISPGATAGIIIGGITLVSAALSAAMYFIHHWSQSRERSMHMSRQLV